jgi:hypothetical protein
LGAVVKVSVWLSNIGNACVALIGTSSIETWSVLSDVVANSWSIESLNEFYAVHLIVDVCCTGESI